MTRAAISATRPECPESLPGFEQLQRFWEPDTARWTVKLLPGEYYVTRNDEAITTVLGSCISACIRDSSAQVGGMNHFMLPEDLSFDDDKSAGAFDREITRYGSYAMERLINDLLKLGASRQRLEIKLFGGSRILASMTDIGAHNIAFIKQYLSLEGLAVMAHDLGGERPRKVVYFPATGRARMKTLRPIENRSIADREQLYLARLRRAQAGGDMELLS
jgi:chemotaxis protein CheD